MDGILTRGALAVAASLPVLAACGGGGTASPKPATSGAPSLPPAAAGAPVVKTPKKATRAAQCDGLLRTGEISRVLGRAAKPSGTKQAGVCQYELAHESTVQVLLVGTLRPRVLRQKPPPVAAPDVAGDPALVLRNDEGPDVRACVYYVRFSRGGALDTLTVNVILQKTAKDDVCPAARRLATKALHRLPDQ